MKKLPRNFLKKLKLTKNRKNIAKISSGTIVGQGISILTLPIITRLYGAEIIGVWALINSIALIINSISDLGLINSIMIESKDAVEKNYKVVSTLSALISVLGSGFVTVLYFLLSKNIEVNIVVFFLFLSVISFTLQQIQICYAWLNRNGKYDVLMKNPIINNSTYGILAIIFGMFGFNAYGYFIAHIIGQVITLINMKRNLPRIMFTFKIADFKNIISKNKRFFFYQLPTNIIGKIKGQLPTLLIKTFWGSEILGYYSISLKLLHMPSNLLASAIGRVFFQTTSEMKRQGKAIGQFVYTTMKRAMKIAIVPLALLIAFGDIAAIVFLGEEWAIAGDFLRILGLQYFFIFIMNTVQGLSITLDKQKYAMISLVTQAVAYVIAFSAGKILFNNIYITLIIMSVMIIVINIIYFCMLYIVMKISWRKYVKSISISLLIMLIISAFLRFIVIHSGLLNLIFNKIGIKYINFIL